MRSPTMRIFHEIIEDDQRMVGLDGERVCTLRTLPNCSVSFKLTLCRWTRRSSCTRAKAQKPTKLLTAFKNRSKRMI